MKRLMFLRMLLPLTVLLVVPVGVLGTDCGQILEHGIFNTTSTATVEQRTKTLVNWLSQNTFQSYQQAVDISGQLGIPIDGIPLEIGGANKESSWQQYQANLQSLNFSDEKVLRLFSQVVNSVDQGIVNAWKECVVNAKGVTHSVIELSDDPKIFAIKLIYDPVGPPYTAVIESFSVKPDTVNCQPSISTTWPFRDEIKDGGLPLTCHRASAADAVQVTGSTKKGMIYAKLPASIPASPTSTSPPNDQEITTDLVPIDFSVRNKTQSPGCQCGYDNQITFPNGPYKVKVGEEFLFRYDGSAVCHGQGFDRFQGTINWGPSFTTLHDLSDGEYPAIAGTVKVKFSKRGDYNVVVNIVLDCLQAVNGVNLRNTCRAQGTTEVHVR